MASATPGLTAGGADASGGNTGLCWELLSRKGILLQRNILFNNMEFKMQLGAFLCLCSIHQQSQLGTVLGCSPGVLHSQTSPEGEFLGWVSPRPGSSLPSCRAVQAEPGGSSLCQVKAACIQRATLFVSLLFFIPGGFASLLLISPPSLVPPHLVYCE